MQPKLGRLGLPAPRFPGPQVPRPFPSASSLPWSSSGARASRGLGHPRPTSGPCTAAPSPRPRCTPPGVPRLPQLRSGSGRVAAPSPRDTPASPARRAVPALFCCDSEKDAGWGRPGCFPGRVCAAPRPSASAPARNTGLGEREVAPRGPGRGPGPGRRHPWPTPARPAPARPRGLSTSGSGSSSPGLRFPGAHPARPLWGWAGREGRLQPDGAGSAALALGFRRAAGSAGSRPGSPAPAGGPESAGTGSHFPAAPGPLHPWGSQGSEWDGLARVTRQVGQRGAATAAVAPGLGFPRGLHGDRENRRGTGSGERGLSCSKPCWPGSGGTPGLAGVPSSPAVRTQPWRVL